MIVDLNLHFTYADLIYNYIEREWPDALQEYRRAFTDFYTNQLGEHFVEIDDVLDVLEFIICELDIPNEFNIGYPVLDDDLMDMAKILMAPVFQLQLEIGG